MYFYNACYVIVRQPMIFLLGIDFYLHTVQLRQILTNNPVAAFDSGVGSLSIIRELKKEIPHEDLLYFADRYHFPYGNKSHQQLYEIILASVKFLENYKPKVIVVASITPSVQILHKVKTRVSSQIIGARWQNGINWFRREYQQATTSRK